MTAYCHSGTELAPSVQAVQWNVGEIVGTGNLQAGDGRFNTSDVPVDVSIFQPEGKYSLMQTAFTVRHSNGKRFYD